MLMLTSQSTELQSYCPLRILLTVQIHTPVFLVPQIYELIYHVLQQNNRHHRINANCIRLAERYIFIYVSQKRPKKISGDHLGQRSSRSQLCFFLSASMWMLLTSSVLLLATACLCVIYTESNKNKLIISHCDIMAET